MSLDFQGRGLAFGFRPRVCRFAMMLVVLGLCRGELRAVGASIEVSGTLQVWMADDFAGHHVQTTYLLEETGTGRTYSLQFGPLMVPGLPSGAVVHVQGIRHGNDIIVTNLASVATSGVGPPKVAGEQQTLVLVLNFTNATVACSVATVSNTVFSLAQSSVNSVYQETSFSNLLWTGLVAGPYTISFGSSSCDPTGWANAADAAAAAAGVDVAAYAHKVYVLPDPGSCGWGGLATIGGNPSRAWVSSCNSVFQYAHEMGHGLGMNHASSDANNDGIVDLEYGDNSDFMSASYILTRLNAPHMLQMAWTPQNSTQVLTTSGTYQVAALEPPATNGAWPQALLFPISGSGDSYYVSYRQPIGLDANLVSSYTAGVCIHRWCCAANTKLITTLADGGTFADSASGFTLRQLSHASSSASLDVELLANAPPVLPVFTSFKATPNGTFSLSGTGALGQVYWLLVASSLAPPIAWASIDTNTADTNGAFTFSDLNAANFTRRFYRLRTP